MSGHAKKRRIDVSYVEAFKAGDSDAFNYIYNYYKNSLYYFILSYTKNRQDAEEVFQDTFVRIHNRIQDLERLESFESWAFSVAYSMTMSFLRRNRKKQHYQLEEDLEVEDNFSITENYEKGEVVTTLKKEFEELNPIYKSVAQLRYLEELSVSEIAEILSVPIGTVKRRLSRVREIMQPILEKQGITPNKYFSMAGIPVLYQVIKEVVIEQQVSSVVSNSILATAASSTTVSASSVIGGGFLLKLATVGVLMLGTGVFYQSVSPSNEDANNPIGIVESVAYDKEKTNKDIEVEFELIKEVSIDQVSILMNNQEVPFEVNGKQLLFIASSNGKYEINIEDYVGTMEINNIDKHPPLLNEISEHESGIKLSTNDEGFGVDYQESYIEYQGRHYNISENGEVIGGFNGEIVLQLYDQVGNRSTYQITVED